MNGFTIRVMECGWEEFRWEVAGNGGGSVVWSGTADSAEQAFKDALRIAANYPTLMEAGSQ